MHLILALLPRSTHRTPHFAHVFDVVCSPTLITCIRSTINTKEWRLILCKVNRNCCGGCGADLHSPIHSCIRHTNIYFTFQMCPISFPSARTFRDVVVPTKVYGFFVGCNSFPDGLHESGQKLFAKVHRRVFHRQKKKTIETFRENSSQHRLNTICMRPHRHMIEMRRCRLNALVRSIIGV